MNGFAFSSAPLDPAAQRQALEDPSAGGYASFEGWVRDHNEGRQVRRLEYEAYEALAIKEGERIVAEALTRFPIRRAACVHRIGDLGLGELAVWVGVSAAHRAEAFAACRYIIDEVKHRVPIWKKEHYADGDSGWVNCERCAEVAHDHGHVHHHEGTHEQVQAGAAPAAADYSRQIALPEVGTAGQARLAAARVLVVGAGGLGVPVLQYLVAAGVGHVTVVDGDRVEASNLHRQPLYGIGDIGRAKAEVAAERLRALNPHVTIAARAEQATATNIDELLGAQDLVVECTDSFRSKFLVNDAVLRARIAAVYASVYQYEGQLQVYRPQADWPCLRCLWPQAPADGLVGNCAVAGVLGPVPAALGALQAMSALKLLLGIEEPAEPALHVFDLLALRSHTVRTRRDPSCDHTGRTVGVADEPGPPLECAFATLDEARAAGFELLDIREAWERALDPPEVDPGAHLPLSDWFEGRVELPRGPRYLVICAHGVRSLALTEQLQELGYAEVRSLRGGLAGLGIGA
jgi:adenylyltransferase/sulfurtransferase